MNSKRDKTEAGALLEFKSIHFKFIYIELFTTDVVTKRLYRNPDPKSYEQDYEGTQPSVGDGR